MSNPERLVFERVGIAEEICVTPHSKEMNTLRAVGVPRERDLAEALSRCSDEWFQCFLREMQKCSTVRHFKLVTTLALADVHALSGFVPAGHPVAYGVEGTESAREYPKDVSFGGAVGDGFMADVAGGDVDPGFGADTGDSARLLELRQAIDTHLFWANMADDMAGDYVARVKQVGEELFSEGRPKRERELEALCGRQRKELRRFNREARARREGNVPLHVTQDRWLQKLHALEQKIALATATQADLLAIERLKRWLKVYP